MASVILLRVTEWLNLGLARTVSNIVVLKTESELQYTEKYNYALDLQDPTIQKFKLVQT